jgi:hypothetical protein
MTAEHVVAFLTRPLVYLPKYAPTPPAWPLWVILRSQLSSSKGPLSE